MSKLLFCGACGDLVSPGLNDNDPRWCGCKRHAVWWSYARSGHIRVYDREFPGRANHPGGKAWFIGIHNSILSFGGMVGDPNAPINDTRDPTSPVQLGNYLTRRGWTAELLAMTPDSYLFKQANSMIVRFYPGATSDSSYAATLPDGSAP